MNEANESLGANGDGDDGDGAGSKRLVWTEELHLRFEHAVSQLGTENAKPQAILRLMGVAGITTRNIKSHLQKYRLRLAKKQQGGGARGGGGRIGSAGGAICS